MKSSFVRPLIGVALIACLVSTAASQSPAPRKRIVELEREEEFGDVRMPYRPSGPFVTGRHIERLGPYVATQVNVNSGGANIVGDAANEPSFAIDRNNPDKIVVGWRQFDSITSNFRQGGVGWSSDGGSTWASYKHTPGVFRSDPVIEWATDGKFHYNSLQNSFFSDNFISSNGGASFLGPYSATGGDKQWIVMDRNGGASNGFQYQCWSTAGNNYSGRQFSRSTNGGTTWMDPINIPQQPVWGVPEIGLNSEVYIGGTNNSLPDFGFARSSNAKNPAVTPTFDLVRSVSLGGEISIQQVINPVGLSGQTWLVCDRGAASPHKGNIYMLCSVDRTPSAAGNPCDVMIARSTNGGSTWGSPVRVNDDPLNGNKYHWFGTLSVSPRGRLDSIWNDTRHDAANATSKLFYSYSLDGGLTWAPNIALTSAFNQSLGYPQQNKMGDYIGLISENHRSHAVFTATFNGEEDVYYMKIPAEPVQFKVPVVLQDYLRVPPAIAVAVEIRSPGTTTPIATVSGTLDASSNLTASIPGEFAPGTYDVAIKGSHFLRAVISNVNFNAPVIQRATPVQQINGDIDGDNTVSILDYSDLSNAFDSGPGNSNWNPEADLDGDDTVSILDYSILSNNFDLSGQP